MFPCIRMILNWIKWLKYKSQLKILAKKTLFFYLSLNFYCNFFNSKDREFIVCEYFYFDLIDRIEWKCHWTDFEDDVVNRCTRWKNNIIKIPHYQNAFFRSFYIEGLYHFKHIEKLDDEKVKNLTNRYGEMWRNISSISLLSQSECLCSSRLRVLRNLWKCLTNSSLLYLWIVHS